MFIFLHFVVIIFFKFFFLWRPQTRVVTISLEILFKKWCLICRNFSWTTYTFCCTSPGRVNHLGAGPGNQAYIRFIVCMCSVLVAVVKLSALAKWLARKTLLIKPNCGEGIVSTKPSSVQFSSVQFSSPGLTWCWVLSTSGPRHSN